jgi:DNA repair exonuclease SbcCD ATPase subunit
MPYIKEYFNKYNPRENEILFDYADTYPNALLNRINKRTKKKFKDYNKDIYPHLFRHSRLTELANNRLLNEPQLRKFAGWSKSSDMPSIYFHLDDESLRKELINQEPKKKEKISFNKNNIRCPNCSEINNKINAFCWKCGKVLNEELASKKFKEEQKIKQKIKKLKNENEKLKSQMNKIKEENKDIKDFLGEFSKLKKEISEFKEWKQDHDEYQRYLEDKKAEKEANKKRY